MLQATWLKRACDERKIEYRDIAVVCHLILDQQRSLDLKDYANLLQAINKLCSDINATCINFKTSKRKNLLPQSIQLPKSFELREYIKNKTKEGQANALNKCAFLKPSNNQDMLDWCLVKELALQLTCVVGEVLEFAEMLQREEGPISCDERDARSELLDDTHDIIKDSAKFYGIISQFSHQNEPSLPIFRCSY